MNLQRTGLQNLRLFVWPPPEIVRIHVPTIDENIRLIQQQSFVVPGSARAARVASIHGDGEGGVAGPGGLPPGPGGVPPGPGENGEGTGGGGRGEGFIPGDGVGFGPKGTGAGGGDGGMMGAGSG